MCFKNTVTPGSTASGYDVIGSAGTYATSGYNSLYLSKQNTGYYYTILEFPALSANMIYRFADLGSSSGAVPAITSGNLSNSNNYILRQIDNTGELDKSNIYQNSSTGNIGINTSSPAASAILDLNGGGTKGFKLPIIPTGTNLPSSPVQGLMVYAQEDNDVSRTEGIYVHTGTAWKRLTWV